VFTVCIKAVFAHLQPLILYLRRQKH